jgi:hypothetical protein
VLPLIREVHQDLKSQIRACDYVTVNALEMIQDMLMGATTRPDVKYLWERSQRIIGDSRRMCDEKRLPRTTSINSYRLRQPPPSIISESSSTSSVDGMTGPVQQSYRPTMYTDAYVTEPERMNTSTGNDVSLPLRPRASQRFKHTTRASAPTISSFSSVPQDPTHASVPRQKRIEKQRSEEYPPHIMQNDNRQFIGRRHSSRHNINPRPPSRQVKRFSEGTAGIAGGFDLHASEHQLPRRSTIDRWESWDTAPPRQGTGHQKILENDGYNAFTDSPKEMDIQTPPTEGESPIPYGPTRQARKPTAHNGPTYQYQNAANPTPNNENLGLGLNIRVSESTQSTTKLSTDDVPKLSIGDALIWRSRKKQGQHPTLEGSWLLNRVQQRDHVNIHLFTST